MYYIACTPLNFCHAGWHARTRGAAALLPRSSPRRITSMICSVGPLAELVKSSPLMNYRFPSLKTPPAPFASYTKDCEDLLGAHFEELNTQERRQEPGHPRTDPRESTHSAAYRSAIVVFGRCLHCDLPATPRPVLVDHPYQSNQARS